jgi:hypothetical protein
MNKFKQQKGENSTKYLTLNAMNHLYIKDQVKNNIKENCQIKRKLKKLRLLIIALYARKIFQKYLLSYIAHIDIVPPALDYGPRFVPVIALSAEGILPSLRLLGIQRTKDFHNSISIQEILINKFINFNIKKRVYLSAISKTPH